MYGIYYNRTTPFLAFLEGMVRVFDWGTLLELRKRWRKGKSEPEPDSQRDKEWGDRIVDWYIRDAIAGFEAEERDKLAQDPMLPRRSCAVADITLGPLSTQEVILRYEEIVPGACDRIMSRASERLDHDGKAEIDLLKERARQGYWGMAAGFILSMLLAGGALCLIFFGHDWAGFSLVGLNITLALCVSVYISKAQVRRKLYTRDFFPVKRRKRNPTAR